MKSSNARETPETCAGSGVITAVDAATRTNAMKDPLDRLVELLEKETDLYRLLLKAVSREKEAILQSDLENLNRICKEKENTILKIQIMEEQRIANLKMLAAGTGTPSADLTLRKLIDLVDSPYRERFEAILDTWRDLIGRIRNINKHNRGLLTHSVDLVRGSLALLNNLINATPVYRRSGTLFEQRRTGTLFSSDV